MGNVRHSRLPDKDIDEATLDAGQQDVWVTGFWRRLPYLGIAALLTIPFLMAGVIYLLVDSNEKEVSQWAFVGLHWQPQVWVAIGSTLSGALLNFAFVEGLVIFFWTHAQAGTTLRDLHDYCESAHALLALRTLLSRRVNAVAIACILLTISFARNPLLQRASTVAPQDFRFDGVTTLRAAHELDPMRLVSQLADGNVEVFFQPLLESLREFRLGRGMTFPGVECNGQCRTKVKAAGFRSECSSSTYNYTISEDDALDKARALGCLEYYRTGGAATGANASEVNARCRAHGSFLNTPVFQIAYAAVNTSGAAVLMSRFKDSRDCGGIGQRRTCRLTPAVREYDVDITNGSVALANTTTVTASGVGELLPPREPAMQRLEAATWARVAGSLFPPMTVEHRRWTARNNSLRFVGQCDGQLGGNDSCAVGLGGFSGAMLLYRMDQPANSSACELAYRDPMPDMLRSLHDISFRLAFITAKARDDEAATAADRAAYDTQTANWTQTVPFAGVAARAAFRTHWAFVAVGAAVTLLGWAAVLPLYFGWWRLGRSATLSPLETALAFDAPLLRGAVPSNASAERIVRRVGGVRVRYGVEKAAVDHSHHHHDHDAVAAVDGGEDRAGQELRLRYDKGDVEVPVNGMALA